jgi:translation initiation factor 2 subunit 3
MAQPELNIMTAGHVDHGKTTLTWALTGRFTDVHSESLKRGITIKLGYADAVISRCEKCPAGHQLTTGEKCPRGHGAVSLVRRVSFVDAPGHETLMATAIAASSIVDGALLVIAANEPCPQPQTTEHLAVLEAAGVKNLIVVQNKVDLLPKDKALEHYRSIKAFLAGTPFEHAPIIPVAANAKLNTDALLEAIQRAIPTPKRDPDAQPRMYVARSFDINKPGTAPEKLTGGILGGSLIRGKLKEGDAILVLPGGLRKRGAKEAYEPVKTRIESIHTGGERVKEAGPGGLLALATSLDPSLTHSDSLVGCIVGHEGQLPPVRSELALEVKPVSRALEKFPETYVTNEPLVLGVGTATTVGFVKGFKKNRVELTLKKPVAADRDALVAVMRRAGQRWRLFGTARLVG